MKRNLALLLLVLPLTLSILGGCTVVYEDQWHPHRYYGWR
jgi:hypothetical protein